MKELKGIYENTPEIPERWCVRRTPENAEILNAWADSKKKLHRTKNEGWVFFDGESYSDTLKDTKLPEITFEQWQAIPKVAEWLKEFRTEFYYQFVSDVENGLEKLEERDIIGYEAPFDMYSGEVKKGMVFIKAKNWPNRYEIPLPERLALGIGQYLPPAEWVETWKPVYAKPVFKVGDWVTFEDLPTKKTFNIDKIDPITEFDGTQRVISAGINYSAKCCRLATPEEIEAARPKRKYMKQVWCIVGVSESEIKAHTFLYTKEGMPIKFGSKQEAEDWLLKSAVDDRIYKVEPFEVVAYE